MRFMIGILMCGAAFGQTAAGKLEFDAASVKPSAPPGNGPIAIGGRGGPGSSDPGRVNYYFASLKMLLTIAYNVKPYQISGPSWIDSERYDLTATVPEGTTKEQSSVMLQNLLAERFGVKLHHESKDLPRYELTVAKGGPKLKASAAEPDPPADRVADPPPLPKGPPPIGKDGFPQLPAGRKGTMMMMTPKGVRMAAGMSTVSSLADMLGNMLASPVVDKTGLTGVYEFTLDFSRESMQGDPLGMSPPPGKGGAGPIGVGAIVTGPGPGPAPENGPLSAADQPDAPSLFVAVQEQLGLKLEKKRGPLDLIVIDRAEKVPTEN